jgi:hypothetical protein
MPARAAGGGQQVGVADDVDAGVWRLVPDLGQRAGELACRRLDLLPDLVGAAGGVVILAGRGTRRGSAGDQDGNQVQFRSDSTIPAIASAGYAARRVMSIVILVMTVSVSSSAAGRQGGPRPAAPCGPDRLAVDTGLLLMACALLIGVPLG